MLAVARGSGLGDVTVVVTRYFGGTLLGTGGLVHAYSDTTREVLAALERTERVETRTLLVAVDYNAYETVRRVLEEHQASFIDEAFAADVTLTVELPVAIVEECKARLASITAGQANIQEM
jgi:putative IMPACT (imprinted ancient) family translation regulator